MAKELQAPAFPYLPLPRPPRRSTSRLFAAAASAIAICIAAIVLVAACTQEATKIPLPVTPAEDRATAPVIRRPLPETPIPNPPETPPSILAPAPAPAIVLPPNAQYVCVTDAGGQRQQTVIEFSAQVATLCVKHPEMGPCQYERNACRASGGRAGRDS